MRPIFHVLRHLDWAGDEAKDGARLTSGGVRSGYICRLFVDDDRGSCGRRPLLSFVYRLLCVFPLIFRDFQSAATFEASRGTFGGQTRKA